MTKPLKVLIADDDQKIIFAFREVLKKDGHVCFEAGDGKEAVNAVLSYSPDLVFMDIQMPGMNGLEALRQIRDLRPLLPVVIITGQGSMETAVQAMQYGAFQYLTKPLSIVQIREEISKTVLTNNITSQNSPRIDIDPLKRHQLIGKSQYMQNVYKLIGSICATENYTTVLITGETGTGKELAARAIHANCPQNHHPFIAINCTAMPETLLESELFGHERGAFTGAAQKKLGKFEVAGKGTIFLDEIGDLSPALQKKLLRVLQEREFERLGGNTLIKVDARFIAATNQDINKKVKTGDFREDLFYRLNVINIHMPSLRERREDIVLLAYFFLTLYSRQFKKQVSVISDEAMEYLNTYDYPGNIRELENIIERAVMLCPGLALRPEHLVTRTPKEVRPCESDLPISSGDFNEARDHLLNIFEKEFLTRKLRQFGGNISEAARDSGMSRQNFHRLIRKHDLKKMDPPNRDF
jgi:DNA-binding NtrC family response regulator